MPKKGFRYSPERKKEIYGGDYGLRIWENRKSKLTDEQVFKKDNGCYLTTSRYYYRRRRREEGTYRCDECGLDSWRGRTLTLQTDHINGDRHDNRRENLRLLCPNCHSQTDNFGGKNKGAYA